MRASGGSGQRQQFFLVVIFLAMLIDGILLAVDRANTIRDRASDLRPVGFNYSYLRR